MKAAHSYPYMRLAQIFQEDYSDVLLLAQYEQRVLRGAPARPTLVERDAIGRLVGPPENSARYAALRDEVVLSVREFAQIQREGWD